MPRGGRRPGAGAPRGNMNALKHGSYSRQFATVGALLASNPTVREALLAIADRHSLRQRKADEVAALLLTRLFERAEEVATGRLRPQLDDRSGKGREGLNLDLPVDDLDSIKIAGARAGLRQLKSHVRHAARKNKNEVQSIIS